MHSASSARLLLASLLVSNLFAAVLAGAQTASVRLLVQSSPLAGFRYHAGAEVWGALRLGDPLELSREPENPFDARAIAVTWHGRKLGYVPRRQNAAIAWAMDRGEALRARISRLRAHPNPARRIEFEVYIE